MAAANVSDEKQNYFEKAQELYCSLDIASAIHGQLVFIAVLNVYLSITAFLGSVLILVAVRKDSSLHPPSKLLLRSLAVTDLCTGLFSEPLYVTSLVTVVNEHWNICRYVALTFLFLFIYLFICYILQNYLQKYTIHYITYITRATYNTVLRYVSFHFCTHTEREKKVNK